tara:strand:+ start:1639 stop:2511 length:873 start_codon:yes stop_codon:yes gene_type:complete
MKNRFLTVALYATSKSERILSIAKQCKEVLVSKKIKIFANENFLQLKSKNLLIKTDQEIIKDADLLLAIGGDGTMLNCSREYGSEGIPILGINLGNLGFLADINPDDLTSSLLEVLEGKYSADSRFFIEASITGSKKKYLALNEAVIHSGAIAQMIDFDLFIDNTFVFSQKADGLIISTNTGSTAYSLSGGGPIIHPELDALCILSIFPHSLSSSPLVLSPRSQIKVVLNQNSKRCKLSLDSGETVSLKKNDIINIQQSKKFLRLIHPMGHSFYEACRNKLGWGIGIVKN